MLNNYKADISMKGTVIFGVREKSLTCVSPKVTFQFCPCGKRFWTKATLEGLVCHVTLIPVIPQIGMVRESLVTVDTLVRVFLCMDATMAQELRFGDERQVAVLADEFPYKLIERC